MAINAAYKRRHSLHKLMMSIPFTSLFVKVFYRRKYPSLKKDVCGIEFPNPLGLGGGVDMDCEYYNKLASAGFGFVEIGSVTPLPQDALMPNKGLKHAVYRLKKEHPKSIIGANICKNVTTNNELAAKDYEKCFAQLYDFVDMFIVNVSSPFVESVTDLQEIDRLSDILDRLVNSRMYFDIYRPIFVKISPDLTLFEVDDVVNYCLRSGIDGIVACNLGKNTTEDIFEKNLAMVKYINEKSKGRLTIIGSGGIRTPEMAKQMLDAGASLVEICTAFVTKGPSLVRKTLKYLEKSQTSPSR